MNRFEEALSRLVLCTTKEEAAALNSRLSRLEPGSMCGVDTEYFGHDGGAPAFKATMFSSQYSWRENGRMYLAYVHNHGRSEGIYWALQPWLESDQWRKTLHNAGVDWHVFKNHGIDPAEFRWDTMVMDWACDENRENRHGLKECAKDFLGHDRKEFAETFGSPQLRKDGQPYASGRMIVPSLPEYVAQSECPSSWTQIQAGKTEIERRWRTLITYAVADVFDGLELFDHYCTKLKRLPWQGDKTMLDEFATKKTRIVELAYRMERRGLPFDVHFAQQMSKRAEEDLNQLSTGICSWLGAPINPNSGTQMAQLLHGSGVQNVMKGKKILYSFQGLGLPVFEKTPGGQPKTDSANLIKLVAHAEMRKLKDASGRPLHEKLTLFTTFSKRSTQKKTYLDKNIERARRVPGWRPDQAFGRLHGRNNIIGTTSGRWAMSQPNLQNVSTGKKDVYNVRDCVVAPPGKVLIVMDFSQLEYRLLAHLAREKKLIKMFHAGWDMHSLTTYNVFSEVRDHVNKNGGLSTQGLECIPELFKAHRDVAKILNFEIMYGVGPNKLAEQLKITKSEAEARIEGWFSGYPGVRPWMDSILHQARTRGYVRTIGGRYRRPNPRRINSNDRGIRGEEERTITNSIVQGSGADIMLQALLKTEANARLREMRCDLVLSVHDEGVWEVPEQHAAESISIIKPLAEKPYATDLLVPFPVSIHSGPSWAVTK